jgi:hypothetical protein
MLGNIPLGDASTLGTVFGVLSSIVIAYRFGARSKERDVGPLTAAAQDVKNAGSECIRAYDEWGNGLCQNSLSRQERKEIRREVKAGKLELSEAVARLEARGASAIEGDP